MTEVVDATSPDLLEEAASTVAAALQAGKLVVLPTDTVYGLVALPSDRGTIERIVALKDRPDRQPMALLVASTEQALGVCEADARVLRIMEWGWPGALTLVLNRRPGWDHDLGGVPTSIGVRRPRSATVQLVTSLVGPIVATSANLHGHPTPTTIDGVLEHLGGRVDLVVDGGRLTDVPSAVVDVTGPEPLVLRSGPIPVPELMAVWSGD